MNNFKDFCNEISDIVEQEVISWHGGNTISHEQAIALMRHNYMLGGFEIDYHSIDHSRHNLALLGLDGIFFEITNDFFRRTYNPARLFFPNTFQCYMERDKKALEDYYAVFKCKYNNCKSKQELDELKMYIAEELWNNTMYNSLTYVFGG